MTKPQEQQAVSRWHYPTGRGRDLRIDFMRGFAMIIMVVAHLEVFSIFNLLTSERLGLISGAEGFVIFSGFVLGQVYRARLPIDGWITSTYKIYSRVWKLYIVSLSISLIIWLLSFIPFINTHEVTTFTDRAANIVYPLYPTDDFHLATYLNRWLYLQSSPHETQVLALYIFLMLITPVAFWMFNKGDQRNFLLFSWFLYFLYHKHQWHVVHTQAENAFPLLAWQLLFFHGLAIGWFKHEIASYMHGKLKTAILTACITVTLIMFFIAQNHTNPFLPEWAHLRIIPAATFDQIYSHAIKNELGIIRLINDFAFYVTFYWLLTICWKPFNKALGWYLIPVGQASLYVFIIHVFVILLASQFVSFHLQPDNWLLNTAVHAGALMLIWWMTKRKIGMSFIPN